MIGQRLKLLRLELDKSQTYIAKDLNISQQTYSFYENEKRSPDYETLKKIASYYNVSMAYLLGETDQKNSSPTLPQVAPPPVADPNVINIKALSSLERHLVKAYLELDYDVRQKLVKHFREAFDTYKEEETAQKDIEAELERYRLELEAELLAKKTVSSNNRKRNLG